MPPTLPMMPAISAQPTPLQAALQGTGAVWAAVGQNEGSQASMATGKTLGALRVASNAVAPGDAFIALRGTRADGHDFVGDAIARGAGVLILENLPVGIDIPADVAVAIVPDTARALGILAQRRIGDPTRHGLALVGITGTNGKTTVSSLLHGLYQALGHHAGLIGTVHHRSGLATLPSAHTTPDALGLADLFARMAEDGADACFMEVSSHALAQRRTAGLCFAGAVFTNLTHDHLDYHGTFQNYLEAKRRLFDELEPGAFALANADSKHHAVMLQNTRATRHTYALEGPATFEARILEDGPAGLVLRIEGQTLHTLLRGKFNASNLLAAYATARLLGQHQVDATQAAAEATLEAAEVLSALSALSAPAGRMQPVHGPNGRLALIDYAHTPDALQNALETLAPYRIQGSAIVCIAGCGGNRDAAKRPDMARIAAQLSDRAILTSDNPRTESPEAILDAMMEGIAGLPPHERARVLRIANRREAIGAAVAMLRPNDVLLVAGKGHETYQEIDGVRHPFDDAAEVAAAFAHAFGNATDVGTRPAPAITLPPIHFPKS